MTTAIIFHEVQDGDVWAKAWKKGVDQAGIALMTSYSVRHSILQPQPGSLR